MDALAVLPTRDKDLLAQVEVLVLFSPGLQGGGPRIPAQLPANRTHMWLTVDVHGRITRNGDRHVVEDLRMENCGQDVSELLEPLSNEIADYVSDNN